MDILSITELTDERLAEYAVEVREAFDAIAELDAPTRQQIDEAEALADHLDEIEAESTKRLDAAKELATRAAALRTRFSTPKDSTEPPEPKPDEEDEENDEEETEQPQPKAEVVPGEVIEVVDEVAAKGRVATLAKKVARPAKPAPSRVPVSITAAADVPEFATGSKLDDMTRVAQATINRMRGFSAPSGDGMSENWQKYGVATFTLDFPEDLTIDRHSDDMEVLNYAVNEHRLPGGSLVAAGGWCAPSETIYDLCPGASTDGMFSLPEVNVARGGIKYTRGPDFSALYSAGFCMTEAQAIAGTTKPCYDVPCPSFTEVRLDACGICIRVPILTNAAYPELVSATIREAMIAHQHAMNARVLAAVATFAGTGAAFTGLGAVSTDTLEALLLAGANQRQKYRLPMNQSLEVVMPYWARDVIFVDLARRADSGMEASLSNVDAIFSAANMNVQFVYDWEELPADATAWPDTIPALIYSAGSFVKGTSNVINLNAVYDAASLSSNVYTGLFFEEGILVAPMCRDADAVEIPVCTAGRSGATDLTCGTTP